MFWFPSTGHLQNCYFQILIYSRVYLRIIYEKIILLGLSLGKLNWGVQALYQNEVKCSAFDMEMIFHSHANKTHFHKKGCALGLILKVRVFGTRKWHISCCPFITKFRVQFHVKLGFWGSPHVRQSEYSVFHAVIPDSRYWILESVELGFRILIVSGIPDSKA